MGRPQLWALRQNEQGKGAHLSEQGLLRGFFAQGFALKSFRDLRWSER